MSYSKLHSSLVNSSLWTESDSVRILFITLLAMCDRQGFVYGSKAGICRLANIEPEDHESAFDALMSPDPDSSDKMRNPENEGKRIEEISGGFKLLNFEYYRGLRNDDERREQTRQAVAKFRAGKPAKAAVSQGKPVKARESHGKQIPSVSASVSDSGSEERKDNKKRCTQKEAEDFCESVGLPRSDGEASFFKWEGNGWTNGGKPIQDWQSTIRSWKLAGHMPSQRPVVSFGKIVPPKPETKIDKEYREWTEKSAKQP